MKVSGSYCRNVLFGGLSFVEITASSRIVEHIAGKHLAIYESRLTASILGLVSQTTRTISLLIVNGYTYLTEEKTISDSLYG
jgi:hypothetical protein